MLKVIDCGSLLSGILILDKVNATPEIIVWLEMEDIMRLLPVLLTVLGPTAPSVNIANVLICETSKSVPVKSMTMESLLKIL